MTAITASKSVVDVKLQQFHEEIKQGQEEVATKAIKQGRLAMKNLTYIVHYSKVWE